MRRGFLDHRDPSSLFRSHIFKMTTQVQCFRRHMQKRMLRASVMARKQSRPWRETLEGRGFDFVLCDLELLELFRLATSLADPSELSVG